MAFSSIHIEGGLIPADLIEQISTGDFSGQSPEHFHLEHHTRLSDEIGSAFSNDVSNQRDDKDHWLNDD